MRQMYVGTIGDMKTLETHFSRMAEKGWMIDKIGMFSHRYHAVKPGKKRFFVDFLPQITMFDYPENEDAQDYRSFCEESGWVFVTANKQFHVFSTEENVPEPTPIHTDNRIQARIYLKACRKYEMFQFICSIFILTLVLFIQCYTNGIEVFLSNMLIFLVIGLSISLIGCLWTAGFVIAWYHRTRIAEKNDLPLPAVNYRLSRARNNTLVACSAIGILFMYAGVILEIRGGMPAWILLITLTPLFGIGLGLWIRRRIDTKRRSRGSNKRLFIIGMIVLLVIVYSMTGVVVSRIISTRGSELSSLDDRPALTLKALGIAEAPDTVDTQIKGSIAVPVRYTHWEFNRQGSARTEICRAVSKTLAQSLYNRFVDELEKRYERYGNDIGYIRELMYLTPEEAVYWGADAGVVSLNQDSYASDLILLSGNTVICLAFHSDDFSMETASEAVRGFWD
jgi:hypothetical protein